MKPRKFDPLHDAFYHLDGTPDLYLEDVQILAVTESIGKPQTEEERNVFTLICLTEAFKRAQLLGKITAEDCISRCQKVDDKFCQKYGFWAYATDYYRKFYQTLGYTNW